MSITKHAKQRISKRRISKEAIEICLKYGKKLHRTGLILISLTKKVINKYNLEPDLEGINVLISVDNVIITAYKNKNKISQFKKLTKFKAKNQKLRLCSA